MQVPKQLQGLSTGHFRLRLFRPIYQASVKARPSFRLRHASKPSHYLNKGQRPPSTAVSGECLRSTEPPSASQATLDLIWTACCQPRPELDVGGPCTHYFTPQGVLTPSDKSRQPNLDLSISLPGCTVTPNDNTLNSDASIPSPTKIRQAKSNCALDLKKKKKKVSQEVRSVHR